MSPSPWTPDDLKQMEALGIPPQEADRQLSLFRNPPPFARLDRPAAVGDGILRLDEAQVRAALGKFEQARAEGRFMKFVPASGAASRMFQVLSKFSAKKTVTRKSLEEESAKGGKEVGQVLALMSSLQHLAFTDDLREALARKGKDLASLLSDGEYLPILQGILRPEGLDYARRPKGLIPFHPTSSGPRTPFQEQLAEAIHTVQDGKKTCRVHFTVSPEHAEECRSHLAQVVPGMEKVFGVKLEVAFSEQKASTQTLAVDGDNRPFRAKGGWFSKGPLVFRPGGHGALLENLNDLQGDLVLIKNIDNVAATAHQRAGLHWKKVLGGTLALVQEQIFERLRKLRSGKADLEEVAKFIRDTFGGAPGKEASSLLRFLDRPLRVCGVVPNTGEPGGGPFWVRSRDGAVSLQIVESAQVDASDGGQAGILKASTHFNPVDLACAVRDPEGKPYDLRLFRDQEAVFISRKSQDGKDLKALELPGLWNGAMADWLTLFVEVPQETFTPVKTVFDLLKPAHQSKT